MCYPQSVKLVVKCFIHYDMCGQVTIRTLHALSARGTDTQKALTVCGDALKPG